MLALPASSSPGPPSLPLSKFHPHSGQPRCHIHLTSHREQNISTNLTSTNNVTRSLEVIALLRREHGTGICIGTSLWSTGAYLERWRRPQNPPSCTVSRIQATDVDSCLKERDPSRVNKPYLNMLQESAAMINRRSFFSVISVSVACLLLTDATVEMRALAATEKTKRRSPFDEERLLEQNRRMQKLNNAPVDFPAFVREGFDVKVLTNDNYVRCDSGLIYLDIKEGQGDSPQDGQQVVFHYIGYNESGRRVDSSYQKGQPAKTRVGIKGMIPGFEEGIRTMKPGGRRRIVIPPELGPPVGPSTFFSAKQFEVFDVELLAVKDCNRRTIGFYSDVSCE